MNGHTPGPWKLDGDLVVAGDGTDVIGSIDLPANARLIAAAPELLAALQEARERMLGNSPAIVKLRAQVDAALAKATQS